MTRPKPKVTYPKRDYATREWLPPPRGSHRQELDGIPFDVRNGYVAMRCTGEAHSNAYIDNCMQCAPNWGVVAVKVESELVLPALAPPAFHVGDRVQYWPSLNGKSFPAVVASEPWQLGGHTWVMRLEDLPQEYAVYTGKKGPRHVVAAACCANCNKVSK